MLYPSALADGKNIVVFDPETIEAAWVRIAEVANIKVEIDWLGQRPTFWASTLLEGR